MTTSPSGLLKAVPNEIEVRSPSLQTGRKPRRRKIQRRTRKSRQMRRGLGSDHGAFQPSRVNQTKHYLSTIAFSFPACVRDRFLQGTLNHDRTDAPSISATVFLAPISNAGSTASNLWYPVPRYLGLNVWRLCIHFYHGRRIQHGTMPISSGFIPR